MYMYLLFSDILHVNENEYFFNNDEHHKGIDDVIITRNEHLVHLLQYPLLFQLQDTDTSR